MLKFRLRTLKLAVLLVASFSGGWAAHRSWKKATLLSLRTRHELLLSRWNGQTAFTLLQEVKQILPRAALTTVDPRIVGSESKLVVEIFIGNSSLDAKTAALIRQAAINADPIMTFDTVVVQDAETGKLY